MRVSFTKLTIFLIICLFFFSDFFLLKKKSQKFLTKTANFIKLVKNKKPRKIGFEPIVVDFGNQYFTN